MLKVIILENNDYQSDYVEKLVTQRRMINETPHSYDMKVWLQTADPQEVIRKVDNEDYLASLDVELDGDISGIDVAEHIRKKAAFAEIVFVTAYKKYLLHTVSRRIEPLDYISKGKDIASITDRLREDIDEAYLRYQSYINGGQKKQDKFTYEPMRGVKRQVNFDDLYYIESVKNENRRLRIVGKNIRIEYHGELRKIADDRLLRVNQSTLINPLAVQEFSKKERLVYFGSDRELTVTVSYRKVKMLSNFLERE